MPWFEQADEKMSVMALRNKLASQSLYTAIWVDGTTDDKVAKFVIRTSCLCETHQTVSLALLPSGSRSKIPRLKIS